MLAVAVDIRIMCKHSVQIHDQLEIHILTL